MEDKEYLEGEEFPHYDDGQYYGPNDELEFTMPEQIEEFNEVSDDLEFSNSSLQEFSSGQTKEKDPKKRKRMLQRMIATFAAASILVVPTVFQTMYIAPEEVIIEPVPPDDPGPTDGPIEVIEDYEITGCWTNGIDFFRFLEDGTGYYYNGTYFCLLNWYQSGDYHIYGGGITGIDVVARTVDFFNMDAVTTMTNQGLIIPTMCNGDSTLYHPSEPGFDDSFVVSLLSVPAKERMTGFWEFKESVTPSPDIEDLAPSYYWITASTITTDIGSESFSHYEHFVESYTVNNNFWMETAGDYHIKFSRGSNSWEFINERFEFYYFVTINEECLLVDPFSGVHIMVKTETPEYFQQYG